MVGCRFPDVVYAMVGALGLAGGHAEVRVSRTTIFRFGPWRGFRVQLLKFRKIHPIFAVPISIPIGKGLKKHTREVYKIYAYYRF